MDGVRHPSDFLLKIFPAFFSKNLIMILASSSVKEEIVKDILLDVVEKVCMNSKSTDSKENVRAENDFDITTNSLQQDLNNEQSSIYQG